MNENLLIVTDAWSPQINGVVTSLTRLGKQLHSQGIRIQWVTPDQFFRIPCPTYPEIGLALGATARLSKILLGGDFDSIHIATEGPLGIAARNLCVRYGLQFTTAYHTKFPEYIEARFRIPARWTYRLMRWFHDSSSAVMVATPSLYRDLEAKGFSNLRFWSRGVDTDLFRPRPDLDRSHKLRSLLGDRFVPPKVLLYVGRVAVEKNIEAFLKLKVPGLKVVVGDGPQRESLSRKYPEVLFVGTRTGEDLAEWYSIADVFVFPSLTDTFGLVLLEALASGTPVAAYPVTGPKDVLKGAPVGALSETLEEAVLSALQIRSEDCVRFAQTYSWEKSAQEFLSHLVPAHSPAFAKILTHAAR